jgi:hypothetical protein
MVNLQYYTIYVLVLLRITTTITMQELNNVIQLADNIHRHVTNPSYQGHQVTLPKVCVLCFWSLLLLVEAFSYKRPQRLRCRAN